MLTDAQMEQRKKGLGASDTPYLMGYSTYKTPLQLYLEKTGLISCEYTETEEQRWGKLLEPVLLAEFGRRNDCDVVSVDTLVHPKYDFMLANLDGYSHKLEAVIEAKVSNSFMKKTWDDALEDGIPMAYLIQIAKQVYLANECGLGNVYLGYCAVLIGGNEYKQFEYKRDKELEEMIVDADCQFWDCVLNRTEPQAINVSDCYLKYRDSMNGKSAEANFDTEIAVKDIKQIKLQIKELEKQQDEHKMTVLNHMKQSEYLKDLDGKLLATWKANKRGTRVFNLK